MLKTSMIILTQTTTYEYNKEQILKIIIQRNTRKINENEYNNINNK